MRHRWTSVFTGLNRDPIYGLSGSLRLTLGNFAKSDAAGENVRPGNRLSLRKSASAKTHGSLMNRFAIPLKAGKSAVALLLNVTLTLGTLTTVSTPALADDSAKKLYNKGQSAEAREDYDAAYDFFRKAYAKSPNDLRMRASYYRLRQTASSTHVTHGRKILQQGDETGALTEFMSL